MSRNLSYPIKESLHFSLSRSGALSLDRADVVIEIYEWVEVPKKNQTLESVSATVNLIAETESANTYEASDIVDPGTEKKIKKRTFRVLLKTVASRVPLSEDVLYEAKRILEALDVQDCDGEDASASQFQERLDQLKAIGDPISFRYKELTARPKASQSAKWYFSELKEIVSGWESKKPWISKEKIDKVQRETKSLKKWLDDKEAEQQK
ncbi:heat shock 70 kDa protein 17-like protein [Tanacetum coccineum]